MPTFATWNVNSVRPRLNHLQDWLRERQPDVALLQEIKVVEENFPREPIEDMGYNLALFGQKTYNGVAILSKGPIEDITKGLPGDDSDEAARYIEAITTLEGEVFRIASVYVPNGQSIGSDKYDYKMRFYRRLHAHMQTVLSHEEPFLLGGDFNVSPEEIDTHDPSKWDGQILFHPDERAALRSLFHLGLADAFRQANPSEHGFSWWDYRNGAWPKNHGMRIDHLLLSAELSDRLSASGVDENTRGWQQPSDHAPVWGQIT